MQLQLNLILDASHQLTLFSATSTINSGGCFLLIQWVTFPTPDLQMQPQLNES